MALYSCRRIRLVAQEGGGANGNKFKLNCYIYTRIINNWSRRDRIRARCASRKRACGKYTGWELQFAFSIGWLDLTILSPANEHYVYIIRLNDFRVDWREYWHCPIWFSQRRNRCNENHFHARAKRVLRKICNSANLFLAILQINLAILNQIWFHSIIKCNPTRSRSLTSRATSFGDSTQIYLALAWNIPLSHSW